MELATRMFPLRHWYPLRCGLSSLAWDEILSYSLFRLGACGLVMRPDGPRPAVYTKPSSSFSGELDCKLLMCGIASKLMAIPFPSISLTTAIGTWSDIEWLRKL